MNLIINSRFRPFTYDEMVKPLFQYKKAYEETEQDYTELSTLTEMWKDIATKEKNPVAYEMYNRYYNDLAAVTEDFSRGMNINNRKALLGLKRRYYQDIEPIVNASKAMKEANDLRTKLGPDALFEVNSYDSLDYFLKGNQANNKYQSKESLMKKAATMSEAAMKLDTAGNPLTQNRLSQIRQELAESAGIVDHDAAGQRAILDTIDTGLFAGIAKSTISSKADKSRSGSRGGGNKRKGSEDSKDEGEYVANDIIYEDQNGRGVVPVDMKPSDTHGYQTSWEDLRKTPSLRKIVEAHIGDSDPRQYEFYTWRSTTTGRDRVQIKRKQPYTKPGPSSPALRSDPSSAYLND